jgi:hypothetical protein
MPLVGRSSAHRDQYVSDLRAAYLGLRLCDPDDAFARDPAVQGRCTSIAGRKWQMRPASDGEADTTAATVHEELPAKIRGFTAARFRLAQGVFHGRSCAWLNGERRVLEAGDFPTRRWWVPTRLEHLDARGVRFVPEWETLPDGSCRVHQVTEIRSLDRYRWIRPSAEDLASLVQVACADEECRLGYGRGLQESIYFHFSAIWKVLEEGLAAVERWARGVLVGKVKPKVGRRTRPRSRGPTRCSTSSSGCGSATGWWSTPRTRPPCSGPRGPGTRWWWPSSSTSPRR